jgi:hypothetical protein
MRFHLTDVQTSFKHNGETLGRELGPDATAADAVMGAARVGLLGRRVDLLSLAAAVEAMAHGSPAASMAFAIHAVAAGAAAHNARFGDLLFRGEQVGAMALSSEDVPAVRDGRLEGRASWVAAVMPGGLAVVGALEGQVAEGERPEP